MLAAYFIHDQDGWRLRGTPERRCSGGWRVDVALRRPSDLGYPDDGYDLPGLVHPAAPAGCGHRPRRQLFATDIGGVGGRAAVRRHTLDARCGRTAAIVDAEPDEPWMLWCGLNAEQEWLADHFGDRCFSVEGRMTPEEKVDLFHRWIDGNAPSS